MAVSMLQGLVSTAWQGAHHIQVQPHLHLVNETRRQALCFIQRLALCAASIRAIPHHASGSLHTPLGACKRLQSHVANWPRIYTKPSDGDIALDFTWPPQLMVAVDGCNRADTIRSDDIAALQGPRLPSSQE